MTRRVLAAIPPTSQVLSASPFLDACLFQYDEKLISPVIRPRALAEVRLSSCSLPLASAPRRRLWLWLVRQWLGCATRRLSLVSSSGKNSRNASASRITNVVLDQVLQFFVLPPQVPLKFSSRGRRETVRLKISGSVFESPAPSARPQKQLVTWHFHPVLPFVLGVLQTSNAAPQAVIYHRL